MLTFETRLDKIRETKIKQTEEKIKRFGRTLDNDDKGIISPPEDFKFTPKSNHENGGFYGAKVCGDNFRELLECHPIYIDPMSSLAGGWMTMLGYYRNNPWKPEFSFTHLSEEIKKYNLVTGIGANHHFCADLTIGLKLGWKGILEKIQYYREKNDASHGEFYDALETIVLGIQNITKRHANEAKKLAELEEDPEIKRSLERMFEVNNSLVNEPPKTFYEACQWLAWFIILGDMYNGCSDAIGPIDQYLKPFYDRDKKAGILREDEAIFHLACLLVKNNSYYQIGGADKDGKDMTNEISFFMLEAAHRLKIPTSICVRVHDRLNPELLHLAVQYLFQDKKGTPNFLGDKATTQGFMNNGYSRELAVTRYKCGCHWCAIPGREYTLNDCVKINFVAVFQVALGEMMKDASVIPSYEELWHRFEKHLKRAVEVIAEAIDFHLEHMHEVFPELVADLFCHGTIEKGLDATNGGVEFYNMCVDGSGLAIVADSFAAIEQRIVREKRLSWKELMMHLDNDYKGAEYIRLMLRNIPRYGSGGSLADENAKLIINIFNKLVKEKRTPNGFNMIPGIFSWANTIPMGEAVGATPNGRHAYAPISHGANPDPGFKESGVLTSMAAAVASVQCNYGNAVPIQLEVDPILGKDNGGIENMEAFIKTYCNDMGGTLMNLNILDKKQILEAHKDPSKYPDLIVRVTGFSAYFAALSEKFRQLVVDRIIEG